MPVVFETHEGREAHEDGLGATAALPFPPALLHEVVARAVRTIATDKKPICLRIVLILRPSKVSRIASEKNWPDFGSGQ